MGIQSRELATPGYIKVLDKNKKECYINPKDLIIDGQHLGAILKGIQDNQRTILDSNKKLQDVHKRLMEENQKKEQLIKELEKKIDDATLFAEES